jgi:gamma-glutamyltranspeptidase/glutathione hydrolase
MNDKLTPHGMNFPANRPVIMGRNGMVCAGHPLASQAGITTLQKGGNAVDAAISIAASLNVVEPHMSGIGGDGFIMIYMKNQDRVSVINATGAAPYAATVDKYLDTGIPDKGILTVSVPGLLKGWVEAHQKYGKCSLEEVFESAIELAENGFPCSNMLANYIAADPLVCRYPTSSSVFTRDGRPIRPGETLYQVDLGKTLRTISKEGDEVFYKGEIARNITDFVKRQGGLLSYKDLSDHKVIWQEPISTEYRGYLVYESPPNSSGHVLLQELNIAENFNLAELGCNTAESIHVMVEAKKLAFADREEYLADPDYVDVPIEGLLSKAYARIRAEAIDLQRASSVIPPGNPWVHSDKAFKNNTPRLKVSSQKEDTTYFCVVDKWGNAVSQLQSLQMPFGSSIVAGDTGILLNNRMTYWHLEEDHVDRLHPGKRVRHTMNPVMVFESNNHKNKKLKIICGTPGADTQVQTNFQILSHILDFGMTVAEAVEAPRWRHMQNPTESTYPHDCKDELRIEGRYSSQVQDSLKDLNHVVSVIGPWDAVGSEMIIEINSNEGVLLGAADPRRDGYAIGW